MKGGQEIENTDFARNNADVKAAETQAQATARARRSRKVSSIGELRQRRS